ncbi:MAG: YsnF/AvaK domain-containing protein [Steroidobacterales bacterium]
MSTRTLTALFDSHAEAERGRQQLAQIGISPGMIEIMDQTAGTQTAPREESSWEKFKHLLMSDSERSEYEEGIRRGGSLLTASVDDSLTERTVAALEQCHPIDISERAAEWRKSGWSSPLQSTPAAGTARGRSDGEREEVIPVAEEQLRVSKRQVERGGVRVRAYVVEQPVQEDVRLREEHVDVERRPATQTSAAGRDDLLKERTVEMRERGEEPVIQKETRVKEEVAIRKHAEERVQPVKETVRRTQVDIEDNHGRISQPGSGAPKGAESRTPRH